MPLPIPKPGSQGTPAAEMAAKVKTWVDLARSSLPDSMVKTLGEMVLGMVPTDMADPQMADLTVPLMPPVVGMASRGALRAVKKAGTLGQAVSRKVRVPLTLRAPQTDVEAALQNVTAGQRHPFYETADTLSDTALQREYFRLRGQKSGADVPEQVRILEEVAAERGLPLGGAKSAEGTLGAALTRIPNPLKAYHGSPHDFDQFSLSKIGTGEGAQAYGHGLYFAENEGVAKEYRKQLTDLRVSAAKRQLQQSGDDVDTAIAKVKAEIDRLKSLPNAGNDAAKRDRFVALQEDKLSELNAFKNTGSMSPGRTYEVNLHATPDELLDWDKPLSEQPQKVREALEAKGIREKTPDEQWAAKYEMAKTFYEKPFHHLNAIEQQEVLRAVEANKITKGAEAYRKAGKDATAEQASTILKDAGIKGIQYLDQGSRGGNSNRWLVTSPSGVVRDFGTEAAAKDAMAKIEGAKLTNPSATRNFVIFDDQLIEIKRKFGFATTAAAAEWVRQNGGVVQSRDE